MTEKLHNRMAEFFKGSPAISIALLLGERGNP